MCSYLRWVNLMLVPVEDLNLDLVDAVKDQLLALGIRIGRHLQRVGAGDPDGHALHNLALGVLDEDLESKEGLLVNVATFYCHDSKEADI